MQRALSTDTHTTMRQLLIILVIAGLGYFGWDYYQSHNGVLPISIPFLSKSGDAESPAGEGAAPGGPGHAAAGPAPVFVSKVKVPDAPAGAKAVAPPGYFYMMERVSVETASGVIAVVPGDLVKLIQRKENGRLRVTIDLADIVKGRDEQATPDRQGWQDFDVKEEQVTQDPEVAQVAEKRDFEKRLRHR